MKEKGTMQKTFTRRSLLKFAGGSAAGLVLTPIPWKVIDDIAIWTQNWSWMPKPAHGPIRQRFTTCSLCPAGCGMRARCVGDQPVSLTGIAGHPLSHGSLCPVGLVGHHLPYHPARVTSPLRRNGGAGQPEFSAVPMNEALHAIGRAVASLQEGAGGAVAVFDRRPGRVVSLAYRNLLAGMKKSYYIVPPAESTAFGMLGDMVRDLPGEPGVELEKARTILSFGAPVLDGWESPGLPALLLARRGTAGDGGAFRLIQVETKYSATAALADSWYPIKPGTEAALALALAHVLVNEKLIDEAYIRKAAEDFEKAPEVSYRELLGRYEPATAAMVTGIPEAEIRHMARSLVTEAPSVVLAGSDPAGGPLGREESIAICGLNLLLGGFSKAGPLQIRQPVPEPDLADGRVPLGPTSLASVPDGSIAVLILDSAENGAGFPWKLIEKKMIAQGSVVVALSPYAAGLAMHADWIIPAPAFMESYEEILPAASAAVGSYGISAPLLPAPAGIPDAIAFIRQLAAASGIPAQGEIDTLSVEDLLKRRVASIHQCGRGQVFGYSSRSNSALASFASADVLWKTMAEGGLWSDSLMEKPSRLRFRLMGRDSDDYRRLAAVDRGRVPADGSQAASFPLVLIPFGWQASSATGQVSPVMTKLFGESNLRTSGNEIRIHPDTGRQNGLKDGGPMVLETAAGSWNTKVRFVASIMPGVLLAPVGPDPAGLGRPASTHDNILSLCQLDGDSCWRVTRARVREA